MGANRRNKLGVQSRRFSICRILKDDLDCHYEIVIDYKITD